MSDASAAASARPRVAYFCMEYGLDNSFKIFSGGLGILAGDLIKAAHDADYPLAAVGILWRQGYTSQTIGENGMPVDAYPEYRYDFLKETGVEVAVEIRGQTVRCKVWLCDCFGNAPLYLLDTFLPGNPAQFTTGQLYGWFDEERLAQEIVLGVGGVRALDALGVAPDIYHFNEGHAAFAGLELIRREVEAGAAFKDAVAAVRRRIVFTTHTPVLAGNESHSIRAMQYAGADLGFTKSELKKIGGDPFNMTVAGLNLSCRANAVAELHAETAREMWKHVKTPYKIQAVTNGVHCGTWQDARIAKAAVAASEACARAIAAHTPAGGAEAEGCESGGYLDALMATHALAKHELVAEIERRTAKQCVGGLQGGESGQAGQGSQGGHGLQAGQGSQGGHGLQGLHGGVRLDPERLLIGFARRAAPYKRSDLIFRDHKAVEELLESGKVQIVFSGKAHPNDMGGKEIVANLYKMSLQYPNSVVFLQNYDMEIGRLLTRGCDVWLNNPIRPMEASGTSGMKAAMNGVLNLSVLDGWWPEGCVHGVNGWQIGSGYEGDDCDAVDGQSLVKTLSEEVIPTYYGDRRKWSAMMVSSIEMATSRFSAERMLNDYVSKIYTARGRAG